VELWTLERVLPQTALAVVADDMFLVVPKLRAKVRTCAMVKQLVYVNLLHE